MLEAIVTRRAAALVPLALLLAALPADVGGVTSVAIYKVNVPVAVPVDIEPLPDGRFLVASQTDGRVLLLSSAFTVQATPVIDINSHPPTGEYGLLGLARHPAWPSEPWIYAFYTDPGGLAKTQRIVRFSFPAGATSAGAVQNVVTGLPASPYCCHNGGRIAFGPDGLLYASLGENMLQPLAQDPLAPHGSILRYTDTGAIAEGNPWPASAAVVKGLRNPFGLTFDPVWGMVVTDNGPSTFDGPGGLDEVNLLSVGANAGWPLARGDTNLPTMTAPLWHSGNQHIAPTGVTVPRESDNPAWDGKVLWCNYNLNVAWAIDPAAADPTPSSTGVECRFDVAQDAAGRLVFSTFGALWVYEAA